MSCNMRQLFLVTLMFVAALAACDVQANVSCYPEPPVALSIESISVPASPRMGQVLGNPQGYALDALNAVSCSYAAGIVFDHWSYLSVARNMRFTGKYFGHSGLSLPIYTTGTVGVGFGLMAQDRDGGEWKSISQGVTILRGPIRPGLATWGVRVRVVFFVTGTISGGALFSQPFAEFRVHPDFNSPIYSPSGLSLSGRPSNLPARCPRLRFRSIWTLWQLRSSGAWAVSPAVPAAIFSCNVREGRAAAKMYC